MFDQLFKQPCALSRQRNAPLASERASFLAQRAEDGAAPGTLVRLARELLVIVQELDLKQQHLITPLAIEAAADRWARQQKRRHRSRTARWSRIFFQQTATHWLRFLGRLFVPEPEPKPFASLVDTLPTTYSTSADCRRQRSPITNGTSSGFSPGSAHSGGFSRKFPLRIPMHFLPARGCIGAASPSRPARRH